jgi:hypothetical protein
MANNGEMKWRKWRRKPAISKIMKAYESMKAAMAMAKKVIGQRISSIMAYQSALAIIM